MSAVTTATGFAVARATRSSAGEGDSSTSVVLPPSPAPANQFAKHSERIEPEEGKVALCEYVDEQSKRGARARKRCWWKQAWWFRFGQGVVPDWDCLPKMFPKATPQQRKEKLKDFLKHCWFFREQEPAEEDVPVRLAGITKEWYVRFIGEKRWKKKEGDGSVVFEAFAFYDTRQRHGDDRAVQGTVMDVKTKKQCLEVDVLSRQRCEHLEPVSDQEKDAEGCVALRVTGYQQTVIIKGMFCNLVALYFCTGTVCLTKDTLLAHLGARAKRKIAKLGFSLGQLASVVQNAGTPYRITKAPQLHGDLLRIITQQDHQVLFGVQGTYRRKLAFHCCAYCPFRGMLYIKPRQVQLVEAHHRTPAGVQLLMQQYGITAVLSAYYVKVLKKRIGETQSIDVPCVECGSPDDSGGDDATIVICDLCSRGFHLRCLRSEAQPDLEAPADVAWVCPRCTK